MIGPHLDYACKVWSPHLRRDIDELERVQKLALRLCAKQWDINYENLLYNFNLPSLADRRHYLRLCVMYKIINELVHFPNHVFIPVNSSVLRSSSRPLFHQRFTHTTFFLNSFAPQTCSSWNALPPHVSNSSSLYAFKISLRDCI